MKADTEFSNNPLSDHAIVWEHCLDFLRDNLPASTFNTWFTNIVPVKYDGASMVIAVPSQFFYEYIEENFAKYIKAALLKVTGRNVLLHYTIGEIELPSAAVKAAPQKPEPIAPAFDTRLIAHYTFDTFIEGESNKVPRSIGLTVAQDPCNTPFNPLFIFGPSGVGKTHLANAIGHQALAVNPRLRVLYVSAHLFLVQYTNAVRDNKFNDFIAFYQSIDLLIIDDVQEFIGKTKTQETLFHIFNYLHNNRKQLVLTCDREPALLQGMEDRLLNRFKWGMTAELCNPAYELRRRILLSKVARSGTRYPDEVIDYIAKHVTSGIRELEGVATSLIAYAIQMSHEIDLELAAYVVKKIVKVNDKPITIDSIVQSVSDYYHIDTALIQSPSRKQAIVSARQIAMYLASKFTNCSTSQIGMMIGRREHSTVIHSCNTVERLLKVDKNLQQQVAELSKAFVRE